MIAAVAVAIVLALIAMHRIGDLVPALIVLGAAAFVIFALPSFPGSPVACLHATQGCRTTRQLDWLVGLAFAAPAGLAVAYKTLRGDRRGTTGTWRRS